MKVKIVEVSPRDGLQNETQILSSADKIEFINQLSATGLPVIEAASFVSPKWIPQLADGATVLRDIEWKPEVHYPVLVPNKHGLENALAAGAKDIAIFTTPSELFSQKNTNCSVEQSLERLQEVVILATQKSLGVRGYVSCVLGCPFEGKMSPEKVVHIAERLLAMGCNEISLGDTIGVGTPLQTQALLKLVASKVPLEKMAVHFHDTYGQALANIFAALELGVAIVDSSVAGLGGCPYAMGASGNVATEDVVYMLQGMGICTKVDLPRLIKVGQWITNKLHCPTRSKVGLAMSKNCILR